MDVYIKRMPVWRMHFAHKLSDKLFSKNNRVYQQQKSQNYPVEYDVIQLSHAVFSL